MLGDVIVYGGTVRALERVGEMIWGNERGLGK